MIKLIVNADDFGFSRGVNHGIIDSHVNGIVNSTTMMMNMDAVDHAVELAKLHPRLKVGIHLVLTCGKPLSDNVPSLIDEHGNFKSQSILDETVSLEEVEKEWSAQIDRFIRTGLQPSHFDSHHHVHTRKVLLPVVQRLAYKYNLKVRANGSEPIEGVEALSDISFFDFYGEGAKYDYFDQLSLNVELGGIVEVMCHPAYIDHRLLTGSSYNLPRVRELNILTNTKLPSNLVLL
ncbi:chitin disaccharide deacetylase [Peribacillus alkalitolerans]|uniref:chitin disaccharide deacetylase n=1 Tax=Peribacillus alkalitolerans TaxID=1550385 RepID=UPI0013D7A106|nr:chitin disaccharide deacetylase [Peribacillus alkalitolerans]